MRPPSETLFLLFAISITVPHTSSESRVQFQWCIAFHCYIPGIVTSAENYRRGVLFVRSVEYNNVHAACPNLSKRMLSGLSGTSTHCIYRCAESRLRVAKRLASYVPALWSTFGAKRNERPSYPYVSTVINSLKQLAHDKGCRTQISR